MYYLVKIIFTALIVAAISEVSKRSSVVGAVLASVPLISVLAMIWLYIDTQDVEKVSTLASSVGWLVGATVADPILRVSVADKTGLGFLPEPLGINRAYGCRVWADDCRTAAVWH